MPRAGEELVRLTPRRGVPVHRATIPRTSSQRLREVGAPRLRRDRRARRNRDRGRAADATPDRSRSGRAARRGAAALAGGAIVLRDEGERFRVYVPQELAHDVAVACSTRRRTADHRPEVSLTRRTARRRGGMKDIFRSGGCGGRAASSSGATTSWSSAAVRTGSRPRTTSPSTMASSDVCVLDKSYIGSGAAGATRRSSARTTAPPRARSSTARACACTSASRRSSTST